MIQSNDQDIPTLTDIIKPGDADMTRHFDTQGFKETAITAGIPAEKIEHLLSELLDDMLPAFKQQLIERLLEKLQSEPPR